MTIQQMCERISFMEGLVGWRRTPLQVFNYSPTGELFMIWEWFEIQQAVYEYLINQHTC